LEKGITGKSKRLTFSRRFGFRGKRTETLERITRLEKKKGIKQPSVVAVKGGIGNATISFGEMGFNSRMSESVRIQHAGTEKLCHF